jgi:hypothetical protein
MNAVIFCIFTAHITNFIWQVEKLSSELSLIEQEMETLDMSHKKTSADIESTMLALETTSEQVIDFCSFLAKKNILCFYCL